MDMAVKEHIYLAHQPIMDRRQRIVAFELLFRSGRLDAAGVVDNLVATASVISHAFSNFSLNELVGSTTGFINVGLDLLMSDMVELLPKERVILELLETTAINKQTMQRCRQLREQGYTLALDDVVGSDHPAELLELVEWIKVDVMGMAPDYLRRLVAHLRQWPHLKLVAEKVETREEFELCMELGFERFQGYYFARPSISSRRRVDPSRHALFRLLEQANQEQDLSQIEETFLQYPELSIKLLRLVRSVGVGGGDKIGSIRQALKLLGLRQLKNWVSLLLYAENAESRPGPLMHHAARRGKFMEYLIGMRPGEGDDKAEQQSAAFMMGVLSLIDAVVEQPIHEIIWGLNLSDEIRLGILERQGELGCVLKLAEAVERGDFGEIEPLAREAWIDPADLSGAQVTAMQWAESLEYL